jgi:hypothetical protein
MPAEILAKFCLGAYWFGFGSEHNLYRAVLLATLNCRTEFPPDAQVCLMLSIGSRITRTCFLASNSKFEGDLAVLVCTSIATWLQL